MDASGPSALQRFPVGFHRFLDDENLNYQLNRLVSDGDPELVEKVRGAAPRIGGFDDWEREMLRLAGDAEQAGSFGHAARFVRAAEFFLEPHDPRRPEIYQRFRALIDRAFAGRFERASVASDGASLPVLRLRGAGTRGPLIVHGGFDSFIEEFLPLLDAFRALEFDVVAFEGPGQGAVLIQQGVPMTHEWERPTRAVIDALGLREATLLGISLGGCLAIRAAALEPRIARVVAFDVLDDFFECVASRKGALAPLAAAAFLAVRADALLDAILRAQMKRDLLVRWGIGQGMRITAAGSPAAFLRAARLYRTAPVAKLVTQDVLLLAGAEDHFVPLHQLGRQARTLTRARSVTTRLFTHEEQAASHCQMGNLPLALRTIARWVEGKQRG